MSYFDQSMEPDDWSRAQYESSDEEDNNTESNVITQSQKIELSDPVLNWEPSQDQNKIKCNLLLIAPFGSPSLFVETFLKKNKETKDVFVEKVATISVESSSRTFVKPITLEKDNNKVNIWRVTKSDEKKEDCIVIIQFNDHKMSETYKNDEYRLTSTFYQVKKLIFESVIGQCNSSKGDLFRVVILSELKNWQYNRVFDEEKKNEKLKEVVNLRRLCTNKFDHVVKKNNNLKPILNYRNYSCQSLSSTNLIRNVEACILNHCELDQILAEVYVTIHETHMIEVSSLKCFEEVLLGTISSALDKDIKSIETKYYSETLERSPYIQSNQKNIESLYV